MAEFRMPSLGADMEAGTIVEWRVAPGDRVHRGDVVAVVDTDKADIDAEIFDDGVIGELLVAVGEKVPVGTALATVLDVAAGGAAVEAVPVATAAPEPAAAAAAPEPAAEPAAAAVPAVAAVAGPGEAPVGGHGHRAVAVLSPVVRHLAERNGVDLRAVQGTGVGGTITRHDVEAASRPARTARPRVSPRARRLAARRGADLAQLSGSGPGGAIVGRDVEGAAATPAAPPPAATPAPATPTAAAGGPADRSATRQARMAALMERSNREIPHYWVTRDLDFSTAAAWLADHNAPLPPAERAVAAAVLLAATARAAATMPSLNGQWLDGRLVPSATVDLGLVITLRGGGLLVPVVRGAESLTVSATMARMADLVRRARSGHLRSSDLGEPTITVSNLGDQGADAVLGVIYPPQVALVGFGRVVERPWAEHGLLGVRPVVTASVAGDHRASDGHEASRLLAAVDQLLQSPQTLEEVT